MVSPGAGWLADRKPRFQLAALGVFVWSAATFGSGLAATFAVLVLARALTGVGEASYVVITPSLVSDYYPPARRGRALATFYAAIPVGSALGYVLGGAINARFGLRLLCRELGALRAERQAQGEELAALRRAAAARQAELETARRRVDEAARQAAGEGERAVAAAARRDATAAAGDRRARPTGRRDRGGAGRDRAPWSRAGAARGGGGGTRGSRGGRRRRRGRPGRRPGPRQGARGAARRGGGSRDRQGGPKARRPAGRRRARRRPGLRAAVEAALARRPARTSCTRSAVRDLADERGALIVEERADGGRLAPADARERRFLDAAERRRRRLLADAIRRDGNGVARRLLARAAWVPDLAACLAIQAALPAGWIVVAARRLGRRRRAGRRARRRRLGAASGGPRRPARGRRRAR